MSCRRRARLCSRDVNSVHHQEEDGRKKGTDDETIGAKKAKTTARSIAINQSTKDQHCDGASKSRSNKPFAIKTDASCSSSSVTASSSSSSSSSSSATASSSSSLTHSVALQNKKTAHETTLEHFDAADQHLPEFATEYVNDIYKYFREVEGKCGPNPEYMSKQTDINERMRAILVDWLVEVHLKFKLMPQTLYLTVDVLDRFLEREVLPRTKLQLVGCTAMLVASKYEEIYAPEARDFVYISDRAFSRQDLLQMESVMLNTLKFNMTVPTIHTFMQRFCKVAGADDKTKQLATFYVERMLQEYSMLKFLPSKLAAASLRLALLALGDKPWTLALQRHTRYTEPALQPCMTNIVSLVEKGEYRTLLAVKKKYTSSTFLEVARVALPNIVVSPSK